MTGAAGTGPAGAHRSAVLEVLGAATRLGLTSFGGPVAHLGYFRQEYVVRRRWLDEAAYADVVALCQVLPGPASSQVGMAVGIRRAGLAGGLAAWLGFTLPSAVAMVAFQQGLRALPVTGSGWLEGLEVAAVAVVAQAVWGMARSLAPDRPRGTVALLATVAALLWPSGLGQVAVIAGGALAGLGFAPRSAPSPMPARPARVAPRPAVGKPLAATMLALLGALLLALPLVRRLVPSEALTVADGFFRAGALVFGGGHVVLPLLQAEVVGHQGITAEQFVAGYGAAQAVPGPLFTFAAYLGAARSVAPSGLAGGALALVAVFLPSFLLVAGVLPFWDQLRSQARVRGALWGVNAAVVGLLLAALYHPLWTSAIRGPGDLARAMAAFALLALWKVPAWLVVTLSAAGGRWLATP